MTKSLSLEEAGPKEKHVRLVDIFILCFRMTSPLRKIGPYKFLSDSFQNSRNGYISKSRSRRVLAKVNL